MTDHWTSPLPPALDAPTEAEMDRAAARFPLWAYAPCPGNNCGASVRVVEGRAPGQCPICHHLFTPPELDQLEAEALDGE